MSSVKRTIFAAGVLLALLAGCKTQNPAAPAAAPGTPSHGKAVQLPPDSGDNLAPNILDWDGTVQKHYKQPGEFTAKFTFALTNVSPEPVLIYDTSTTCECTVAKLPKQPWVVPSGGAGEIHASIDLRKKTLSVTNDIIVYTSKGNRRLTVEAIVP
ncbi:MAG TPA: DUF1573 domain-containing protein [Verrucomicrobiae bacterium]|nr:DUF1573 domain-containing protein [Verrucomicrobiae bacterium]